MSKLLIVRTCQRAPSQVTGISLPAELEQEQKQKQK